jgi:hypothetical protein
LTRWASKPASLLRRRQLLPTPDDLQTETVIERYTVG